MGIENFNQKPKSIIDDMLNKIKLAKILKPVYDNQPKPSEFVGAMANDDKHARDYSLEQIQLDNAYVETKSEVIETTNSSYGQEELNRRTDNYEHAEIAEAMFTDLINNVWFSEVIAIMTADYDDLKNGIDTVLKYKDGTFLGLGFDFTISSKADQISKKLNAEWDNHVRKGRVAKVKYFKDPDTGRKSNKITPRFIVGSSNDFVEEAAAAYLSGNQQSLKNHPMRDSFFRQIEMQLDHALDYFQAVIKDGGFDPQSPDYKRFEFAARQYQKVKAALDKLKEGADKEAPIDTLVSHEYSKNSMAEKTIKNFINNGVSN